MIQILIQMNKNKIYQLLNSIGNDYYNHYKTINLTKYFNKNYNYHFIILECKDKGKELEN